VLFSVGNAEQDVDWVSAYDPLRRQGRFFGRAPWSGGIVDLQVGSGATTGNLKPYYSKWTHVAMVHEQMNGTYTAVYLDGVLAVDGNTGGQAVGTGGSVNSDMRSLSLCQWGFWSEVYHQVRVTTTHTPRETGDGRLRTQHR